MNSNLKADDCSKFEVTEVLASQNELKGDFKRLESLASGKLFYKESSGYCVPTNETYLVALSADGYPRILSLIQGHTPKVSMHTFESDEILLLYYFAGGNQYIMEPFKLNDDSLEKINAPSMSSNLRSIEIVDNLISVKNQNYSEELEAQVKTDKYQYKDNSFFLVNPPSDTNKKEVNNIQISENIRSTFTNCEGEPKAAWVLISPKAFPESMSGKSAQLKFLVDDESKPYDVKLVEGDEAIADWSKRALLRSKFPNKPSSCWLVKYEYVD